MFSCVPDGADARARIDVALWGLGHGSKYGFRRRHACLSGEARISFCDSYGRSSGLRDLSDRGETAVSGGAAETAVASPGRSLFKQNPKIETAVESQVSKSARPGAPPGYFAVNVLGQVAVILAPEMLATRLSGVPLLEKREKWGTPIFYHPTSRAARLYLLVGDVCYPPSASGEFPATSEIDEKG